MNNKIFRLTVIITGALFISSCVPVFQDFYVDVKIPGKYSLPVIDKKIAIFTATSENYLKKTPFFINDSSLMVTFSVGMARGLESYMNLYEGQIPTYSLDALTLNRPDSIVADALFRISESDFVILLDNLIFEEPKLADQSRFNQIVKGNSIYYSVPGYISARVFDKYNSAIPPLAISDTIFVELGVDDLDSLNNKVVQKKLFKTISLSLGKEIASLIVPKWDTEKRALFIYYTPEWMEAYKKANLFEWNNAIKIWSSLIDENKREFSAAAAFNIAVACELSDKYELALEWLDYSYKLHPYPQTFIYKQIISGRIEEKNK